MHLVPVTPMLGAFLELMFEQEALADERDVCFTID
jgi:hypothetical protein